MRLGSDHRWRWIALAVLVTWLFAIAVAAAAAAYRLHMRFSTDSAWWQLRRYVDHAPLDGELDGRINLLLLGVPGAGYPGARMTDTILLLSVFPDKRRATLLSIPRDLAIEFPDRTMHKINEAYDYADDPGGRGARAALRIIETTLGVPVHYYAMIDIEGLAAVIDGIGGIWVWIDRSFQDVAFRRAGSPDAFFAAGWSHMGGERALTFSRARNGTNGEGTDFARASRQQKVLVAVRDRVSSLRVKLSPFAIWRLSDALTGSLDTDLQPWQMAALRRLLAGVEVERLPQSVFTDVLDPSYDSDGVFRLHPRTGLAPIRHRVRNVLERPSVADRLDALAASCGGVALPTRPGAAPLVVPRWVWDLAAPVAAATSQTVRGIVVHHDGVRYEPGASGEEKVTDLRRSLLRNHGWTDLPYHYLVDVDGRVFEGAAENAATRTRTWHDPSDLLHIALLGDYSVDHPSEAQIDSLLRLVAVKADEYRLPASHVRLHSDLVATSCPGDFARERLVPNPFGACRKDPPSPQPLSPF